MGGTWTKIENPTQDQGNGLKKAYYCDSPYLAVEMLLKETEQSESSHTALYAGLTVGGAAIAIAAVYGVNKRLSKARDD